MRAATALGAPEGIATAVSRAAATRVLSVGVTVAVGVIAARAGGPEARAVYDLTHRAAVLAPWIVGLGVGWGAAELVRRGLVGRPWATEVVWRAAGATGVLAAGVGVGLSAARGAAIAPMVAAIGTLLAVGLCDALAVVLRAGGGHALADRIVLVRAVTVLLIAIPLLLAAGGGLAVVIAWCGGSVVALSWLLVVDPASRPRSSRTREAWRGRWRAVSRCSAAGWAHPLPGVWAAAVDTTAVLVTVRAGGVGDAAPLSVALGVAALLVLPAYGAQIVAVTWRGQPDGGLLVRRVVLPTAVTGVLAIPVLAVSLPLLLGGGYEQTALLFASALPAVVLSATGTVLTGVALRHHGPRVGGIHLVLLAVAVPVLILIGDEGAPAAIGCLTSLHITRTAVLHRLLVSRRGTVAHWFRPGLGGSGRVGSTRS